MAGFGMGLVTILLFLLAVLTEPSVSALLVSLMSDPPVARAVTPAVPAATLSMELRVSSWCVPFLTQDHGVGQVR